MGRGGLFFKEFFLFFLFTGLYDFGRESVQFCWHFIEAIFALSLFFKVCMFKFTDFNRWRYILDILRETGYVPCNSLVNFIAILGDNNY